MIIEDHYVKVTLIFALTSLSPYNKDEPSGDKEIQYLSFLIWYGPFKY